MKKFFAEISDNLEYFLKKKIFGKLNHMAVDQKPHVKNPIYLQ